MIINTATGNVIQQVTYDEFGISSNAAPLISIGFAAGLYDSDTRLVRFGARDYDPEVGRWTSKDPILFKGGDTNLYGYVLNDPVNFVDTMGLWGIGITLNFSGVFGAGYEGSIGFYIGTDANGHLDAGVTGAGGSGFGYDLGVSLNAAYYPGTTEDMAGNSTNYNTGFGPVSGTVYTEPASGRKLGYGVGVGYSPRVGASVTNSTTGTLGVRDVPCP